MKINATVQLIISNCCTLYVRVIQIGISLGMMVPIYVMYVMIILWFFIHAVMEVTTVIFARQPVSTGVSSEFRERESV